MAHSAGRRSALRRPRSARLDGQVRLRSAGTGLPPGADLLLGLRADAGGAEETARSRSQPVHHARDRPQIYYLIGALAVLAIVVVAVERFIPRTAPISAATEAVSGASPA